MSRRFRIWRSFTSRPRLLDVKSERGMRKMDSCLAGDTLRLFGFLCLLWLSCNSIARGEFPFGTKTSPNSIWSSFGNETYFSHVGDYQTTRAQETAEERLFFSDEDFTDADLIDRYDSKQVGNSTLYVPAKDVSSSKIIISAQYGWKGASDEYGDVYVLYGDCQAMQDDGRATAPVAVVWIDQRRREDGALSCGSKVYAYFEKDGSAGMQIDLKSACVSAKTDDNVWLGELQSLSDVDLRIALPGDAQLQPDEVYFRALNFLKQEYSNKSEPNSYDREPVSLETTNDSFFDAGETISDERSNPTISDGKSVLGWNNSGSGDVIREIPETSDVGVKTAGLAGNLKTVKQRFRFIDRYETQHNIQPLNDTFDGKSAWSVSNGFTLIVQGVNIANVVSNDVLELSADSAVVWTSVVDLERLDEIDVDDLDFEIYLDGNVVFREGNNVVYAKRMYYDVKHRVGIIEEAEMIAEIPDMEGAFFRLGAARIVQETPNTLRATDAWTSTSMMGKPTYRLQSNSVTAERRSRPLYDALTGNAVIDSKTGLQATEDKELVIAENNFVSIGNMPVFYWPWMAMDIRDRALYLKSLKFGHDGVLGYQVRTSWDLFQLLQANNRPEGVEWDLDLDYLSKRGFGHGSTFRYERDSLWNWDSRAVGLANYYGVYDKGKDNLGNGRQGISFGHKYRYRGIWKHRQELNCDWFNCGLTDDCSIREGWTFTGQIGKSSDRNFLPEFFEDEWNTSSNPETRFELKRTINNRSFGVDLAVRSDSFYTQSNWLPKLDHFWLGQSLFNSPFVWYEHTKVGFAQFKTADPPYDPVDKSLFRYLDWELSSDSTSNVPEFGGTTTLSGDSLVFSTRHEIDAPFQLGAIKTTPYALGEYGFWGRAEGEKNVSRLYGRLGLRLNLPIWTINSDVESRTWYLNGLAHKMNFVVDASYSEANKNYDDLILFDQIDDWQVQDFRRRYSVTTFSGSGQSGLDAIPVRFDERYYAIRQGMLAGNVSSPATELVDDLQLVRIGWDNRWQTKRGPAGNRRVVDWITLNAGINLYPKNSENFGKASGLLDYESSWQIGDRLAVLSSGLYDFWGSGQKITRIGVQRKRPGLSSCYLGVDRLSGPIDSTYLNFGLTYRASEKWGIGFSNSFDLSEGYNIGQKLTVSRIGESFVVTVGASRNESKNNWGVNLSVEPVFLFDKNKREEGLLGLGNM